MQQRQRGMSLVEIMVAVMIGLIGILIITQAYLTNDRFNRSTLGEGGAQTNGLAALYLNPLTPDEVFRVTAAGERLPQKSTFFYPKLPTGLVLRTLEEDGA